MCNKKLKGAANECLTSVETDKESKTTKKIIPIIQKSNFDRLVAENNTFKKKSMQGLKKLSLSCTETSSCMITKSK